MSFLRFKHVFAALMTLAFVSAFFLPQSINEVPRSHVQALFAPVAKPIRRIASALHAKVAPVAVKDYASPNSPRAAADVLRENQELWQRVENLSAQLDKLKELNSDRARMGDLRKLCTPFAVYGSDSANRDSLLLQ